MGDDEGRTPLHVVTGGQAADPPDPRVAAVLEVLAGRSTAEVAHRWAVDPALVHRWVRGFVEAGTAQVTNRPDPTAARQRDRFLAGFAHELRTPLAVAQGWVALLAEGDIPPPVVTKTVGRLQASLDRLAESVIDVELLAAASLGLLRLSPRTVLVSDLIAPLRAGADAPLGVGHDLEVTADPELFPRVLRDLWAAGRLAPEPRSLRLDAEVVGPWVEIRVVRDADPIDTEVLQALFDPFDINDDHSGVTIGLYLARALVVAHGGTLGVDQDARRASIWVRLPAVTPLAGLP